MIKSTEENTTKVSPDTITYNTLTHFEFYYIKMNIIMFLRYLSILYLINIFATKFGDLYNINLSYTLTLLKLINIYQTLFYLLICLFYHYTFISIKYLYDYD